MQIGLSYYTILNITHILFNGPLLIYISLAKPQNVYFYYLLLLVGAAIIYSSISKILNNQGYTWLYIHLLLFAPLILIVGYLGAKEENIPYYLYTFLQAIGAGAVGHHIISLIKKLL
jgi:hypothetical protein